MQKVYKSTTSPWTASFYIDRLIEAGVWGPAPEVFTRFAGTDGFDPDLNPPLIKEPNPGVKKIRI